MKTMSRRLHSTIYQWCPTSMIICLLLLASLVLLNRSFSSNCDCMTDSKIYRNEQFILEYIRDRHLLKYDPKLPTNYSASRRSWRDFEDRTWTQTMPKIIAERLNFKRNGFFVECGALDGVFISNTLHLERTYGWSGLLIEADPAPLPILKKRNRNAWVADVCLSPKPYPMKVEMTGHKDEKGNGHIQNTVLEESMKDKRDYNRKFQVQCFPFSMLMAAINRTEVDYFSLDVEGVELDILKTIPFHRIRIKLISVEIRPTNKESIKEFLESKGYKKIREVKVGSEFIHDDLYELQE